MGDVSCRGGTSPFLSVEAAQVVPHLCEISPCGSSTYLLARGSQPGGEDLHSISALQLASKTVQSPLPAKHTATQQLGRTRMAASYGATSVVRVLAEAGPYGEPIDRRSRMRQLVRPAALTWTQARSWKPAGHFDAGDGDEDCSMVMALNLFVLCCIIPVLMCYARPESITPRRILLESCRMAPGLSVCSPRIKY